MLYRCSLKFTVSINRIVSVSHHSIMVGMPMDRNGPNYIYTEKVVGSTPTLSSYSGEVVQWKNSSVSIITNPENGNHTRNYCVGVLSGHRQTPTPESGISIWNWEAVHHVGSIQT